MYCKNIYYLNSYITYTEIYIEYTCISPYLFAFEVTVCWVPTCIYLRCIKEIEIFVAFFPVCLTNNIYTNDSEIPIHRKQKWSLLIFFFFVYIPIVFLLYFSSMYKNLQFYIDKFVCTLSHTLFTFVRCLVYTLVYTYLKGNSIVNIHCWKFVF